MKMDIKRLTKRLHKAMEARRVWIAKTSKPYPGQRDLDEMQRVLLLMKSAEVADEVQTAKAKVERFMRTGHNIPTLEEAKEILFP